MNMETIDWSKFEDKTGKFLKLEPNKPVVIGIRNIAQIESTFTDDNGEPYVVPGLSLGLDLVNNAPTDCQLDINSKRFIALVREYYSQGILFAQQFRVLRTGEGFSTSYTMIPMGFKPGRL
jgi:hypothetical protein